MFKIIMIFSHFPKILDATGLHFQALMQNPLALDILLLLKAWNLLTKI